MNLVDCKNRYEPERLKVLCTNVCTRDRNCEQEISRCMYELLKVLICRILKWYHSHTLPMTGIERQSIHIFALLLASAFSWLNAHGVLFVWLTAQSSQREENTQHHQATQCSWSLSQCPDPFSWGLYLPADALDRISILYLRWSKLTIRSTLSSYPPGSDLDTAMVDQKGCLWSFCRWSHSYSRLTCALKDGVGVDYEHRVVQLFPCGLQ